jgi:mono/diheme cytochrome c family protein
LACAVASAAGPIDPSTLPPSAGQQIDFVKDVQPIFAKSCYGCHGAQKHKSGYRLDVKSIALKGGDIGGAIVPGKGADSPLIHYVAGVDADMVMPPKGERLSPEQVGILRAWIDQGAMWPDSADAAKVKDKADHWAFKPATRPAVPNVTGATNPIDAFIHERLAREKLTPSPEADRRTLIRRLTFDLTGLPPTPAEVDAFIADAQPDAYGKLVDRLLASPRYGERWARHWLDVVHFGETHGYDKDKPRPNAWPYRDYVIRSLNNDKRYSRFVKEQLAGDVLYPGTADGVVATGFIAAGPWDFVGHVELREGTSDKELTRSNDRDDMVMTTMSTFQSLTVHCARCHNHKFDPITQEDYYRLQAVFAGVDRGDRPYDADVQTIARRQRLNADRAALEAKLAALNESLAKVTSPQIAKLDARIAELRPLVLASAPAKESGSASNGYHSEIASSPDVTKWVQVELPTSAAIETVTLVPARPTDFADTPGFGFPARFKLEIADDAAFASPTTVADHTTADFANPGDVPFALSLDGKRARFVRVTATRLWERHKGQNDFVFALGELQVYAGGRNVALGAAVTSADSIEAGRWARRFLVDGFSSRGTLPAHPHAEAFRRLEAERRLLAIAQLDAVTRAALTDVPGQLAAVNRDIAALPPSPQVYAAVPLAKPRPVHFLARGDVKQPKQLMAAGALEVFAGKDVTFPTASTDDEGIRRAALAEWITHERNLLTRRSIVNRVWHYHFGAGIVDSPNDFGHMGATPTHPELLDWLAYWFQDNGESLKALHRLIVTSAAYRQSSSPNPTHEKIDADNRYLWRMNRTRLDAESLRDAILAVTGKLDETRGGPSARQFAFTEGESPVYDYTRVDLEAAGSFRRSIYRFIVRSVPDPFMDTLDCPDPSVLAPKRNTTLTALQALSLLNNPFVVGQSRHLAARVAKDSADLATQITVIYRMALGREPTAEESKLMTDYAAKFGMANACRMLFNSNEFVFVD